MIKIRLHNDTFIINFRYTPSKADLSVFDTLGKTPAGNVPHVQRWYRHIASYSTQERSAWGGQAVTPAAKSAPAPAGKFLYLYRYGFEYKFYWFNFTRFILADDDDDVDLFGSEEEEDDAEAARIREERVAAYSAKKSKKPALIAKSSVLLDVKPWDDETNMAKMEESVRTIVMDGLVWGAAKLVPVGYGINKLQIMCVIEDDKISTDELSEKIESFEDYVQSVDIAAFNKI